MSQGFRTGRWLVVVLLALALIAWAWTGHARASGNRLILTLPRTATVNRYLEVPARDRAGTGGLALTICEQPPGGPNACRPAELVHARGTVRLDLPRPGGYEISVHARGDVITHRQLLWVSHPGGHFTVLAAGDSEMQVLDDDLKSDLAEYGVTVDEDARPSTGLTVPDGFSWLNEAVRDVARLHPDVTIVAMGANEGYADSDDGHPENCCGAAWTAGYSELVLKLARIFEDGHRGHPYWMLLPTPKPANFQALFNSVNAGISAAVAHARDRVSLLDARAFFTPADRYRDTMSYDGQSFTIHEADGIHLDAAADAVEARLIVARLVADRELRPRG